MKILLVNHLPLVGSGSGVYTTNLAKYLNKLGHDICIIMPENETKNSYKEEFKKFKLHPVYFKNEEEIKGQLEFNFPCFTSHSRSNYNFYDMTEEHYQKYCQAFDKAIKEEIEEFKPDIIHAQHIWIISSIACKYNIPTVVTSHGTDIIGIEKGDRFRKQAEFVIEKAKKIIAVSNENKKLIIKNYPISKPEIIYAGYDPKIFNIKEYNKEEVINKYNITYSGQKIILFAGRLSYLKGVDILLKASKQYERENVITIIAGNGDLRKQLKDLAKQLEVKDIYFVGHKSQNKLKELYNIADVFVMPSRMEAFGLVAIEAIACGTPVICSNSGGMKEYINLNVGKIVKNEDVEDLAKTIKETLHELDKYKKEDLSNYAETNFSQEKSMKRLLEIYNEIIN